MDGIGEISPKGATFGEDELKYLIPFARTGHHNMSPSRQKVIKTKPRGFDEETVATFGKVIHADVQMDDGIWALLPEDLLIEVLARMPPFFIFKMRSVRRRWNSILYDSSFLKSHSSVPSHGPCLLASWKSSQSHQCLVFSLPLKTWYKIPFNFLPDWAFWLVGSSGGLVCFSGFDGLTFKALVCNPLTQMWRVLPSMNYNQQRQLIMVVDRADHSFKVIAAGDIYGDKTLPTEVYDSKTNSWSLHQIMPAVNLCSSKMALCDSCLYLETLSPPGMMMYRMDKGQWEHIPAKFPRPLLDGYLVAGAHQRLYLVGRIGLFSTRQSMRIWELDHAKTIWVEISRMPPKHLRALLRLSAERFECFGQDNLICFTSWNQGKGLLYDVDKKAWSWIAGCALHLCNSQLQSLGYAHPGVAMTHNDRVVECVKELGNESKMVAVTKSGRLKGRKMGVNDAPKKEDRNDEMINTGKDMNSPSNVYETPISEDSSVLSNTKTIGTQKLLEATAEIFKMMNKDYHQKARRRPPINNNLPLNDKNEDVAP